MQLTWLDHTGGRRRQLFQADPDVRDRVMALADKWAAQGCGSGGGGGAGGTPPPPGARTPGGASQSGGHTEEDDSTFKVQLAPPTHMQAGPPLELTGDAPQLLTPSQLELLGGAIPVRFRSRAWRVAYSTRSHGISLGNLYRRVSPGSPTITLIRDNGGHVFGCFTTDGWKVQPRYYGGGETFVFNLEPHRLTWPWVTSYHEKNDFFQYSQPDCLALGGAGRFALWLDEDLLCGTSGPCGTFGCGCLAHAEDFRISMVEVLQAAD